MVPGVGAVRREFTLSAVIRQSAAITARIAASAMVRAFEVTTLRHFAYPPTLDRLASGRLAVLESKR